MDSLGQKAKASTILGVEESRLNHFKVQDPYNPQWELEGYISNSEKLYGSMVIFKINDYLTEQVVISTPKQHYPFDKLGRFNFPTAKHINVYEKLDGTNILAYSYKIKGKRHITYKTRLTPVLNKSRWGDWGKMWDEMLIKYPYLYALIERWADCDINLSFELYGSRNKHLVEYPVPLDTALLFGIRNDIGNPKIIDPEKLRVASPGSRKPWSTVPTAKHCASIGDKDDLYSWYQKLRGEQEALNKFNDEGFITGQEGFVWYLFDINSVMHQYKCKPESVEAIHWANTGMSKHSVTTTIINAYELGKEVTWEVVKDLLLEEYTENVIDSKKDVILKCMADVRYRIEFRDNVLRLYEELGMNLRTQKNEVMRALSKHFDRKDMRKVYTNLDSFLPPEDACGD